MTDTQYYITIAVPLLGILINGGLFIYLASKVDKVIEKLGEIDSRIAVLEDRENAKRS